MGARACGPTVVPPTSFLPQDPQTQHSSARVSSTTMQTRLAARLSAAEAAAHATASAHAVLLSEDLFAQALWRWLDPDSKAALRFVSKTMRGQVDGSITRVASPRQEGFSAADLTIALRQWPAVRNLTLLSVGSAAALAPLSTASLAGLASLTVRQVGHASPHAHGRANAWRACMASMCCALTTSPTCSSRSHACGRRTHAPHAWLHAGPPLQLHTASASHAS